MGTRISKPDLVFNLRHSAFQTLSAIRENRHHRGNLRRGSGSAQEAIDFFKIHDRKPLPRSIEPELRDKTAHESPFHQTGKRSPTLSRIRPVVSYNKIKHPREGYTSLQPSRFTACKAGVTISSPPSSPFFLSCSTFSVTRRM